MPSSRAMRRAIGGFLLFLGVLACSSSYEKECVDLCDRVRRCIDMPDPAAIEDCNEQCRAVEEDGQMQLADGRLSEGCYDAVVDSLACANRLNCRELAMSVTSTPARCKDEIRAQSDACTPAN